MEKFKPIIEKYPHMLHGGDYNPDQWQKYPEILSEDVRLMKLANCNVMSVGIFAWSKLEPEEGKYDFSFLDETLDRLSKNGIKAIIATPSGAKPAWMSKNHPEILRVSEDRLKDLHGERHNHCYTSPYYRMKVQQMNRKLAERYKDHDALVMWHVSNEYGGECHCELCQNAFREWLKNKYDNDLDKLNHEYWSAFWSHTYTSWDQIESPSPRGEHSTHALKLDWKRFVTHQTIDFMKNEIAPLREITPDVPVTTNFMGIYPGLDYYKFKDVLDVVSWDNYPAWHSPCGDIQMASDIAFQHDLNRSIKGKPFMLMESTPSLVNWRDVNKLKRPNMHILSSLQAVAHGSDTVQYFQWRKSRGSSEKFHGAVVAHCGHENTRVFKEVSELGKILTKLDDVVGTATKSEVAVIFDWEARWAVEDAQGMKIDDKKYAGTCFKHYYPFWKNGVNVDVIDSEYDFSKYKLIVAPMLYMMKPGVVEKIKNFVQNGGTVVCTYISGYVNENDLCYLGGFPASDLKDVFGIWAEELDTLYDGESNSVKFKNGKEYKAVDYCELIHANTAETLAEYGEDFYAGMSAVTVNKYGKGSAYYIACRDEGDMTVDLYGELIEKLSIEKALDTVLPNGVTAHTREDEEYKYIFIENYNNHEETLTLPDGKYEDMINGGEVSGEIKFVPYGCAILKLSK